MKNRIVGKTGDLTPGPCLDREGESEMLMKSRIVGKTGDLTPGPFPEREGEKYWPVDHIVIRQKLSPGMGERAKELRRNMTPAEELLWARLRANRLGGFHFRRQQVIDGYIADFYCHASNLIIEIDGDSLKGQIKYDKERDAHLIARGFKVLRFSNNEIIDQISIVIEKILNICQASGSPFPYRPALGVLPRRRGLGG